METYGGALKPRMSYFYDMEGEQVARYIWASQYALNKEVLDFGCGYGYGSYFLAETARSVIGVDSDEEAIVFAKANYLPPTLKFILCDSIHEFENSSFDVVISLETIEHLLDHASFMSEVSRVLRPYGEFILSTPNRLFTEQFYIGGRSPNPYHTKEFYPVEIQQLLKNFFGIVEVYAQVWPNVSYLRFRGVASKDKILKGVLAAVPRKMLWKLYLKWRRLSHKTQGRWREFPVLACDSFDSRYPVQAYRCIKQS